MPKTILIVSDLHLTPKFDKSKFAYLANLFKSTERLIVNGDLWSYYYCDFKDFLKSEWRALFPIMLNKGCIYIHGNHDRKEWCDHRTDLFSVENHDRYSLKQNGTVFNIQHGHLISKMSVKNKAVIEYIKKLKLDKYNSAIHKIIIDNLGGKIYSKPGKIFSKKHKRFLKKFLPRGEFLVCGHSHSPEYAPAKRYINTGFINYGYSSYLKINEAVSLILEKY